MTTPWADDPLRGKADDGFNRSPTAETIAGFMDAVFSAESSIVFGVTGPWGSGKSSLLNMIVETLTSDAHPDRDRWVVTAFSPWAAESVAGLLAEFGSALAAALPIDEREMQGARDRRRTLARQIARTMESVPYLGGLSRVTQDALSTEKTFRESFEENANLFRAAALRVLVVVDDVDRLHRDELPSLLKAIRLLGRFPGVNYLLAYDEQTLTDNIRASGVGADDPARAQLFLEKIVQYQFGVPPLRYEVALAQIEQGLRDELATQGRQLSADQCRRLPSVYRHCQALLTTPRAVRRYLAHYRWDLMRTPAGEVDDVDVALVTLLRLQAPADFRRLHSLRDALTTTNDHRAVSSIIEALSQDSGVRAVLASLFLSLPRWRGGICDAEYFDRYFVGIDTSYDIADSDVRLAVESAEVGDHRPLLRAIGGEGPAVVSAQRKARLLLRGRAPRPELLGTVLEADRIASAGRRVLHFETWLAEGLAEVAMTAPEQAQEVLRDVPLERLPSLLLGVCHAARARGTAEKTIRSVVDPWLPAVERLLVEDLRLGDSAPDSWVGLSCLRLDMRLDLRLLERIRIERPELTSDLGALAARCVSSLTPPGKVDRTLLRYVLPDWPAFPPPAADDDRPWSLRRRIAFDAVADVTEPA